MTANIKKGFTLRELLTAKQQGSRSKGFTLIELLIVMAILGVLAVVVLVAINPVQQLARTRDAGRKSGVSQIGRSLEAYYTTHSGSYVTEGTTWLDELVTAGEISTDPSAIAYRTGFTWDGCGNHGIQNSWCYDYDTSNGYAMVVSELESDSEASKCSGANLPFFVWSTSDGRGGIVCAADAPTADVPGTYTFVN